MAGNQANRGGIRLVAKDVDGDGKADMVVGTGEGQGSNVRVYLGKNIVNTNEPAGFQDLNPFRLGYLREWHLRGVKAIRKREASRERQRPESLACRRDSPRHAAAIARVCVGISGERGMEFDGISWRMIKLPMKKADVGGRHVYAASAGYRGRDFFGSQHFLTARRSRIR